MEWARHSRGDDPRWIGQARALSATVGALFVRTFERGERVHQAMLARGWDGAMPTATTTPAPVTEWLRVLVVPAVAAALSARRTEGGRGRDRGGPDVENEGVAGSIKT